MYKAYEERGEYLPECFHLLAQDFNDALPALSFPLQLNMYEMTELLFSVFPLHVSLICVSLVCVRLSVTEVLMPLWKLSLFRVGKTRE